MSDFSTLRKKRKCAWTPTWACSCWTTRSTPARLLWSSRLYPSMACAGHSSTPIANTTHSKTHMFCSVCSKLLDWGVSPQAARDKHQTAGPSRSQTETSLPSAPCSLLLHHNKPWKPQHTPFSSRHRLVWHWIDTFPRNKALSKHIHRARCYSHSRVLTHFTV